MKKKEMRITLPLKPIGKPRMTQRDKWLNPPRPAVARYRAFCDEARLHLPKQIPLLPEKVTITAILAMPSRWSKKKREEMKGTPHKQKPDWDNIGKALSDLIWQNDAVIYHAEVMKVWGEQDFIEVEICTK